ncbi:excinuclease ABC subunit UvrA [Corynebacterium hansenii]|uniref:UvrABC system protein A n=1 Tax=Corynebacterium hansenii TaxID=394964 RepID=A0ABV7ZLT5_9CORY|nr:excinuclease ABC subunit UvrA [Corynebacterium hansenii]WJY99054.1 UvrABC system protein A [Corynebacterium hansenii]
MSEATVHPANATARAAASTAHPADSHGLISVRGARANNLRAVDVDLPKRRLTVFTGVSGSGKSSLVFDTIAAESQRLINETYPSFVQGFMPTPARPDVDLLSGLTTAIVVDQEPMGSNARSTVGTATDAGALLRILFSRVGEPKIGPPNAFSFNVASISGAGAVTKADGTKERREFSILGGQCPACEGLGTVSDFDLTALYDASKSLSEGALTVPGYSMDGWYGRIFAGSGYFDMDKPLGDFTDAELHDLLYREATKIKADGINVTYEGVITKIRKTMLTKDVESMQPHVRAFVERAIVFRPCPACGGTRLSDTARSVTVHGRNIAELSAMQITDLAEWVRSFAATGQSATIAPLLATLRETLESFSDIGLGYLSLDRASGSLSGGEAQRVKMVRHLGSALTDVTYVFDEPTVGLHPHDIARMNDLLLQLRDKGNTVLVVEHKPETIAIADHIVDVGPGAGSEGGEIRFEGDVDGLRASGTLTGRHFDHRAELKEHVRPAAGALEIRGADQNNLRDVDVDVPLGVLTVVTGVAGSGKSSLIHGALGGEGGGVAKQGGGTGHASVIFVDQAPIKGSRRSTVATYAGLADPVRKAFAKANGVKPGLFSANSDGACPTCKGAGMIYPEVSFRGGAATICEDCEGRGFQDAVLEHKLGGRDIAEVLAMTVADALEFFSAGEARVPAAMKILDTLADVGLGYLTLSRTLPTLSGGERQRLKLATHLKGRKSGKAGARGGGKKAGSGGGKNDAAKGGAVKADAATSDASAAVKAGAATAGEVFVLDEPTSGLHLADVDNLLALLDRLVDGGSSVIVIEHHQAVMAHADWIIDLGPGAGHDGGRVVFEGTPADLVAAARDGRGTITGEHLAKYVGV